MNFVFYQREKHLWMCEKVIGGGSGVETEGVRRRYVCGQSKRVSSSFLRVRKGWDSQTKRLSLGWRDSSFSVAIGKDQVVCRLVARTFIKLILVFSMNGSQGLMMDWGMLRIWKERRQTGSILWRMSKECIKEGSVWLRSAWARYAGFWILLSLGGSGEEVETVGTWVLGY